MKKVKLFPRTIHKLDKRFEQHIFVEAIEALENEINIWISKMGYNIVSIDFKPITVERHNNGGCDWTMIVASVIYEED